MTLAQFESLPIDARLSAIWQRMDEIEGSPKKGRFVKPTVQEVAAYARELGKDIDAERFCDFYESKDWLVGKVKMKDWKAAVRNWIKNNAMFATTTPAGPNQDESRRQLLARRADHQQRRQAGG